MNSSSDRPLAAWDIRLTFAWGAELLTGPIVKRVSKMKRRASSQLILQLTTDDMKITRSRE